MQSDLPSTWNNNIIVILIAIIVAAYASQTRIQLPNYIRNLFSSNIFRVVFLSLLLMYSFNKAPHVAIAVALIFVLTLHFLNCQEATENFMSLRYNLRNKKNKKTKNRNKNAIKLKY